MEFKPKAGPDIMRDPKAAKAIEEALSNVLGEGDRCVCVHATAWVRWCVNKCVCVCVCVCVFAGWGCRYIIKNGGAVKFTPVNVGKDKFLA